MNSKLHELTRLSKGRFSKCLRFCTKTDSVYRDD